MSDTLTRVMTFELMDCVNCQISFMVPKGFTETRRRDCRLFYCPNGHQMAYSRDDTEEAKLRRERDRLVQEKARLGEIADQQRKWRVEAEEAKAAAERRVSAARGRITRLKNRANAGLCPCCNRSFVQLQSHMKTKHHGFLAEEVLPGDGATP